MPQVHSNKYLNAKSKKNHKNDYALNDNQIKTVVENII